MYRFKIVQKSLFTGIFLFLVSCVGNAVPSQQDSNKQTLPANQIFQPIVSALKAQTQIPVLLPSYIPLDLPNKPDKIYAVIEKADAYEYSIVLGSDPKCTGGQYCRIGYITSKVITPITLKLEEEYEYISTYYPRRSPEKPGFVTLNDGTKAYFLPYTCAAFCSDSHLAWDQEGYRYSVGLVGSNLKTLLSIANSRITILN